MKANSDLAGTSVRAAHGRGRPQLPGPGSYRVLEQLARLGTAGIEPLAYSVRLSSRTTYDHVRRLERAGLVARIPYRDGGGGTVAITRKGASWVRDDDAPAVFPRSDLPATYVHARAVSWLVADFELTAGDGDYWLGPAELRQDEFWRIRRDDDRGHYPDLGLFRAGQPVAIEVELHSKSNARLRAILNGYEWKISAGNLEFVGYVWTRLAVARAVHRQAQAVRLRRPAIRFTPLEGIIERTRRKAAELKAAENEP